MNTAPNWAGSVKLDEAVLAHVKSLGPVSRNALSKATGIKTTTLCGSLGRLMYIGEVQRCATKVYDTETRRNVIAYEVPNG